MSIAFDFLVSCKIERRGAENENDIKYRWYVKDCMTNTLKYSIF